VLGKPSRNLSLLARRQITVSADPRAKSSGALHKALHRAVPSRTAAAFAALAAAADSHPDTTGTCADLALNGCSHRRVLGLDPEVFIAVASFPHSLQSRLADHRSRGSLMPANSSSAVASAAMLPKVATAGAVAAAADESGPTDPKRRRLGRAPPPPPPSGLCLNWAATIPLRARTDRQHKALPQPLPRQLPCQVEQPLQRDAGSDYGGGEGTSSTPAPAAVRDKQVSAFWSDDVASLSGNVARPSDDLTCLSEELAGELEVTVGVLGVKQGATATARLTPATRSRLCKAALFDRWLELPRANCGPAAAHPPKRLLSEATEQAAEQAIECADGDWVNTVQLGTYGACKRRCGRLHHTGREALLAAGPLRHWVLAPEGHGEFSAGS
jgi:hypothetical protein